MTKKQESTYHHGDLRASLIEVAALMIAEKGIDGLTMRGLAERVGVSQTAPYRHFKDKTAILAAVAEDGFNRLAELTIHIRQQKDMGIVARFCEIYLGYIEFATQNPAHYRLMFGRELGNWKEAHLSLVAASTTALNEVVEIIRMCQEAGQIKSGAPLMYALVLFAELHGLAMLIIDDRMGMVDTIQDLVEFAVRNFLEGAGQGE